MCYVVFKAFANLFEHTMTILENGGKWQEKSYNGVINVHIIVKYTKINA
jgi:hypothetical protein